MTLKEIFYKFYKDEEHKEYLNYSKNIDNIINSLKKRGKLEELTNKEILRTIDNNYDNLMTLRDMTKKIKQFIVRVKAENSKHNTDIFIWKQLKKASFLEDAKEFLEEYQKNNTKKSLTAEEKNILFRTYYIEEYKKNSYKLNLLEEVLLILSDEEADLLDIKIKINDFNSILKKMINN